MCDKGLKRTFQIHSVQLPFRLEAEMNFEGLLPALEPSLPLGVCEVDEDPEPLPTPQQVEDTCCRSLVVNNPSLGRGKVFLVEDPNSTPCTGSDITSGTVCTAAEEQRSLDEWSLSIFHNTRQTRSIECTEDDLDNECEEFKELYAYLHSLRLRGACGHPHKKFATGVLKNVVRMEVYSSFMQKQLEDSLGAEEQVVSMFRADHEGIPLDLKVIAADAGLTVWSESDTSLNLLYDILSMNEQGLCIDYEIVSVTAHSHIASIYAHAGNIPQAKYHIMVALQHSASICDLAVLFTLWTHGWILFLENSGKKDPIPDAVVKQLDQVYGQCMSMFRVLPAWYGDCRRNALAMGKADIHLRIAKDKISRGATVEDPQVYQILQRAKDTLNAVDHPLLFQGNNTKRLAFHNHLWFTLYHLEGNEEKAKKYMRPAVKYWIKTDTPTGYKLAKEVAEMADDPDLMRDVEEATAIYESKVCKRKCQA